MTYQDFVQVVQNTLILSDAAKQQHITAGIGYSVSTQEAIVQVIHTQEAAFLQAVMLHRAHALAQARQSIEVSMAHLREEEAAERAQDTITLSHLSADIAAV